VIPVSRLEVIAGCTFRVLSSVGDPTDAVTYVLVHGIGVSHRYLARLHRELARTSTVHSLDLPGFGGLPKPPVPLGVAAMATALATLLERIGVTRAVLVGHSMGTQWVVELALQRPTLASHLVLIGPVTDDRRRTALAQSIALAVDTLGEPIDGNALVFTDYLRCGPRWYLRQLREMLDYPLEQRVAGAAAPILIVRGGRDPIAGLAWARRLRDNAGSASLIVVPGHQHLVQHTAPRTVSRAIAAFRGGTLRR
jgi:pimeloyl-ACP methyl ester carboxylesterase